MSRISEFHDEKLNSVNFGISYILGDSFNKMASASDVTSPLSNSKSFQDIEALAGTDGNNSLEPYDILSFFLKSLSENLFHNRGVGAGWAG